jgi:hypothetical protein
MSPKKILVNLTVLAVSVGCALLLCEGASRLMLNPGDYLDVEMVSDDILGAVPSTSARSHGFDEWGYRNRKVPETADIVAIGDSHTYGNTATMEHSWPYVVGHLTGRSVYNLGMGGYGPNQYYYLLKTKALRLKPRLIICGFYMGDDFDNAYLMTYGTGYWASLRALNGVTVDMNTWNPEDRVPNPSWFKRVRLWLSRHSVVYQIAAHASSLGELQGDVQIKRAHSLNPLGTSLIVPDQHIEEAFLPGRILHRLDQNSETVREGMRITFKLFAEMNEICKQNHIAFLVAIIPAKEMVFSEFFKNHPELPLSEDLNGTAINGALAKEKTIKFLADSGISFVDTLPALERGVEGELYARSAGDMHPNKNGYRVIAEAISEALKKGDGVAPR